MELIRVGVDLAKNVFQVHGVDQSEKPAWQRRLTRQRWLEMVVKTVEPVARSVWKPVRVHTTGHVGCKH